MKTANCRRAIYVLVSAIALIGLLAAGSSAQQQFELPRQNSQGPMPAYRAPAARLPLPADSDVRPLPQRRPQLPPGPALSPPPHAYQPPAAVVEPVQPVLPAVFRGCWQGKVDDLDSIERLPAGAKVGFWTPKTYRLCYRRIGDSPFVLTFTQAGIEENDRITHAAGRMTLLSTDRRSYASMRSDLRFDEYRTHVSYFGRDTFPVHELTDLDCRVEADGMHVMGLVTGWRSEEPWFRARWHTVFEHIGEIRRQ